MKRFYKTVGVVPLDGGYAVQLDGKQIKTPARQPLRVPGEALAAEIAGEWTAQGEKIEPRSMRHTRLAYTAIDRVLVHRQAVIDEIVRYAVTDVVCYRVPSPAALAERQKTAWDPLVAWVARRHGVSLTITDALLPVEQAPNALEQIRDAVAGFDDFALAGLHTVASACGSAVIALAVADGVLDAEAAWAASLTEESYQIEEWGADTEATNRRLLLLEEISAAARFLELCRGGP